MANYGPDEPRSAANLPPSNPLKCPEPSLTRQSEAQAADINYIMDKYQQTGYLPPMNKAVFFADVSKVGNFDDAMAVVHGIEDTFMELPADVRKEFDNDPAKFIDFTNDRNNMEKMKDLGLLKADEVRPPEIDIDAAVARVIEANKKLEEPIPEQD